jgi:Zn finger protein HypA/HybF involved in hydrogenase expression
MIVKIDISTFKAICNECEKEYSHKGNYNTLSLLIADSGWISLKSNDEWKHYCPQCKQHPWNWRNA